MPKLILFSSNGFSFRIYFRFLHQEDTITKEVCCRSYILLLVCIPGEEMFFKKSLAHIPFFCNKNMMLLQRDLEYLCHTNSRHILNMLKIILSNSENDSIVLEIENYKLKVLVYTYIPMVTLYALVVTSSNQ